MQWPLGGISHPARRVLRGWGARVWVVCTCSPSLVQSITPSGLLCGLGCTSRGQEEGDQISPCPWRSQPGWAMAPDGAVPTSRAARADVLLQTRLSILVGVSGWLCAGGQGPAAARSGGGVWGCACRRRGAGRTHRPEGSLVGMRAEGGVVKAPGCWAGELGSALGGGVRGS